jgi:hypothetical protein
MFYSLNVFDKYSRLCIFALSFFGSVVQLVRMPPCHGGGRGFESRPIRKKSKAPNYWGFFCER